MLIKTIKSLLFCFLFTFVITHPTYSSPNPTYIRNSDDIPFFPEAIIKINNNDLIFVDSYNHSVKKLTSDGKLKAYAGTFLKKDDYGFPMGAYKDGVLLKSTFNKPRGLVEDSKGNIYISDSQNHVIRKISNNQVTTFAGNGKKGLVNGNSKLASFNNPLGLTIDEDDNLYVADSLNHVIRKITPSGNVSTYAGAKNGTRGYKDSIILDSLFNEPSDIKYINNSFYIADTGNHLIRKIENGQVTLFAGKVKETLPNSNYPQGGFKDGTRLEAEFNFPKVLDINEDGFILISDSLNNAIRLIDPSGIVTSPFADHTLSFPLETPRGVLMLEDKIYISDFTNGIIELPINIKTYESKDIEVIINKEPISYGSFSAFMELNNIYLPLGETLKKLNYRVTWNPLDKSILCSRNTSNLKLDTSDFKIIDGKSYISTKTLKATFLLDLTYDLVNKKVTIEGGI